MTPEREAQMREMFQKWADEYGLWDSLPDVHQYAKAVALDSWLACARALEPMLKDAERYQWLRSDDIEVLPGQREILVYMEHLPFTDDPDVLLIGQELDNAIDAAMSAALEGKNATD